MYPRLSFTGTGRRFRRIGRLFPLSRKSKFRSSESNYYAAANLPAGIYLPVGVSNFLHRANFVVLMDRSRSTTSSRQPNIQDERLHTQLVYTMVSPSDSLNLTSGIVTVTAAACHVTGWICDVVAGVKRAPKFVEELRTEVIENRDLLQEFGETIQDAHLQESMQKYLEPLKGSLQGYVTACRHFTQKIPMSNPNASTEVSSWEGFRLYCQEGEIRSLRYRIQHCKENVAVGLQLASM